MDLAGEKVICPAGVEGLPVERSGDMIRGLGALVAGRDGHAGGALADGWPVRVRISVRRRQGSRCWFAIRTASTTPGSRALAPWSSSRSSRRGGPPRQAGSDTYLPGQTPEKLVRLTERMRAGTAAIGRIFDDGGMNVGRLTRYSEDRFSLFSSLGICNRQQVNRFYNPQLIRDHLAAVTGLELEAGEITGRAAAGWELYRELNAR